MGQLFVDYFAAHRDFLVPATLAFAVLLMLWMYGLGFLWAFKEFMEMRMKYCDWRDERRLRKARTIAQTRPWE